MYFFSLRGKMCKKQLSLSYFFPDLLLVAKTKYKVLFFSVLKLVKNMFFFPDPSICPRSHMCKI